MDRFRLLTRRVRVSARVTELQGIGSEGVSGRKGAGRRGEGERNRLSGRGRQRTICCEGSDDDARAERGGTC